MRNAKEQMLKKMAGELYHIKVISVEPFVEDVVRVNIEFLEGPLKDGHHSIEIETD